MLKEASNECKAGRCEDNEWDYRADASGAFCEGCAQDMRRPGRSPRGRWRGQK